MLEKTPFFPPCIFSFPLIYSHSLQISLLFNPLSHFISLYFTSDSYFHPLFIPGLYYRLFSYIPFVRKISLSPTLSFITPVSLSSLLPPPQPPLPLPLSIPPPQPPPTPASTPLTPHQPPTPISNPYFPSPGPSTPYIQLDT